MPADRTFKLGRLAELRQKMKELQVQCDGLAKNIIYHFDPLDMNMDYVFTIDPVKLRIYLKDLETKWNQLKKLEQEVDALKQTLGEGA